MATRTLPWFDTLTESVYALGEAAREYQHAYRAAVLAKENVDLQRRAVHDGRISTLRSNDAWHPHGTTAPHHNAVYDLGDTYLQLELDLQARYERAALLYASGAAWAIRMVQGGEQPAHVGFGRYQDGNCIPWLQLEINGLERYSNRSKVAAAYEAVSARLHACGWAEELAGRAHVTDREAGDMHDAIDAAHDLADATYAYGLLAERAVHYALLEPKREHARQEALQHATEQAGESRA